MITVTLYSTPDEPTSQGVKALLAGLQADYPHQLVEIDVLKEQAMKNAFQGRTPLLKIGPYQLEGEITAERLRVALGAATDRVNHIEKIDHVSYQKLVDRGRTVSGSDKLSLWISNNYIHVFNVLLLLYVGLPFLAPVLVRNGATGPANLIYRAYSIVCHQLPFRSWFLFGQQAYYPRELAGIDGVLTYEDINGNRSVDIYADRQFIGNETVGYKVALCERDVAIYGALLIFGIGFAVTKRRVKGVPWYMWVVLGMGPIALDGLSQLPNLIPGMPAWLPVRESTPLLRTITGSMFGGMTAWYLYPMIEATMDETRRLVSRKKATAEQLGAADR